MALKKHGSYTNKRMWRADIGEFQFEAISKGNEEKVRVDIYKYPAHREDGSGTFIIAKTFDSFDEADGFVSRFEAIDFSLALKRIRDKKCPVCESDDLNSEHDTDEPTMTNESCNNCRAFWTLYPVGFGNLGFEIVYENDDPNSYSELLSVEIKDYISDIEYWPEIIQAVLEQKKMLPALIGIDDSLDKLIAERLKQ